MRVIGLGINPSDRDHKETNLEVGEAFNTDSEPDPKVREAFEIYFPGSFKLYDLIKSRYTNLEFKSLSRDEKYRLCKENEPRILSLIRDFKPDMIILFTVSDKIIIEFVDKFNKDNFEGTMKIIKINHPSYFLRWKRKEWKDGIFKKHLLEKLKENGIKLPDAGKIARL